VTPTDSQTEDEARELETAFQYADIDAEGAAERLVYQLTGE
jgi:hypothetical protein